MKALLGISCGVCFAIVATFALIAAFPQRTTDWPLGITVLLAASVVGAIALRRPRKAWRLTFVANGLVCSFASLWIGLSLPKAAFTAAAAPAAMVMALIAFGGVVFFSSALVFSFPSEDAPVVSTAVRASKKRIYDLAFGGSIAASPRGNAAV